MGDGLVIESHHGAPQRSVRILGLAQPAETLAKVETPAGQTNRLGAAVQSPSQMAMPPTRREAVTIDALRP
jgi:hypothetical protein